MSKERQISQEARRDIIDELRISKIRWYGRLDQTHFLQRIYRLEEKPSSDPRYSNMDQDIWQHTINNDDWPLDWVYDDPRIDLLEGSDEEFLKFICELIHPIVRTAEAETKQLLQIFNSHLEQDGYEIYKANISTLRPIYKARLLTIPTTFTNLSLVNSVFIKDQYTTCHSRLQAGDYDGGISSARSLVEAVLDEINFKCTGEHLRDSGDLSKDYKAVKNLLNLSDQAICHNSLKKVVGALGSLVHNLDTLSNKMGDRHRPVFSAQKHHAKLVIDSAIAMADFLYSTLEFNSDRVASLYADLIEILDSPKRFWPRDKLLNDPNIKLLLDSTDRYIKKSFIDKLILEYKVTSFRTNDVFFATLEILLSDLTSDDILTVYAESQKNDQMITWNNFQKSVESLRPSL